ncbi:hypothetical protein U9M48_019968, partial [Paspalum notatum var. saurae]
VLRLLILYNPFLGQLNSSIGDYSLRLSTAIWVAIWTIERPKCHVTLLIFICTPERFLLSHQAPSPSPRPLISLFALLSHAALLSRAGAASPAALLSPAQCPPPPTCCIQAAASPLPLPLPSHDAGLDGARPPLSRWRGGRSRIRRRRGGGEAAREVAAGGSRRTRSPDALASPDPAEVEAAHKPEKERKRGGERRRRRRRGERRGRGVAGGGSSR